jgi:hypothetical protein
MGLQTAARGHIYTLCMHYKMSQKFKCLGIQFFIICPRTAGEPAHNNRCVCLPQEVGRPRGQALTHGPQTELLKTFKKTVHFAKYLI